MTGTVATPTKTRELHNHHFDSTIWNDFRFREDDIVVAEYEARAVEDPGPECARWLATGEVLGLG